MEKKNAVIYIIIAIIVAGVIGYYVGSATSKGAATANRAGYAAGAGRGAGTRGGATGTGVVTGQIISSDSNSITVQTQNGSTKIVLLSGSTQITKSSKGADSDLTTGQQVMVVGTANSDGSETATNVQIRPAGMYGSSTPMGGAGMSGGQAAGAPAQQ